MARKQIDYTTYEASSAEGPWQVYLFYPDGVWDEDKLTLGEAEKKYPPRDYKWVDVSDERG